jgi:ferredoxin-fold anticodon binding domain-containing protein
MRWSGEHVSARALDVSALMRSAVEERILLKVVTDWNKMGLDGLRLIFSYKKSSL